MSDATNFCSFPLLSQFPGGNYLRHKMSDHTSSSSFSAVFIPLTRISSFNLSPSPSNQVQPLLALPQKVFRSSSSLTQDRPGIECSVCVCTFINYLSRKEEREENEEVCGSNSRFGNFQCEWERDTDERRT